MAGRSYGRWSRSSRTKNPPIPTHMVRYTDGQFGLQHKNFFDLDSAQVFVRQLKAYPRNSDIVIQEYVPGNGWVAIEGENRG